MLQGGLSGAANGAPLMKTIKSTLSWLRSYWGHVQNCFKLRRLLRGRWTHNLRNVYWYDMSLPQAISLRGMLRVLGWGLFRRQNDEISSNYAITNLYLAEPQGDGLQKPAPTVWHCRSLVGMPWHDYESPVAQMLEQNSAVIIEEYLKVKHLLQTHPDDASLAGKGKWKGLFFYAARGQKNHELCNLCPHTTAVLEKLPLCTNFGFVMFSELAPGTHVKPHCGSSNLRLRYHLGLQVPETDTVKLRVAQDERPWSEGKVLAFDDSFEHEVFHRGEKTRVVLVVDCWQPGLKDDEIEILENPIFGRFGRG